MSKTLATAAVPTMTLLAALGVAEAQTFETVAVPALFDEAGAKVTSDGRTMSGTGGAFRLVYPLFDGPDAAPFGSGVFWCRSNPTATPEWFSASVLVSNVSRNGLYCCGWGSIVGAGRWTKDGTMVPIPGLPGSSGGRPLDLSADGSIVVGTAGSGQSLLEAFVWTEATGTQGLGLLPNGLVSFATAVSDDGSHVAGMGDNVMLLDTYQWCRWVDGGPIEPLPVAGEVHGISANGAVILGRGDYGQATAWIDDGSPDGDVLELGWQGSALGATDDGTMIVGTDEAMVEAWIWIAGSGAQPLRQYLLDQGLDAGMFPPLQGAGDISRCGNAIVGWLGEITANEATDASQGDVPDGPTFGESLDTAATLITGTLGDGDRLDCYVIYVEDPASFYATTSSAVDPTARADFDTRLWLYRAGDAFGGPYPVMANDDAPGGAPFASTIADPGIFTALTGEPVSPSAPGPLERGTYFLTIGGYPEDPLDAGDVPIFSLSPFDELHGPNPAAGAFDHWSGTASPGGDYAIALRGVTPIRGQDAFRAVLFDSADIDGDGMVGVAELLLVLGAWGPVERDPADLDGDGNVGVSDLLLVLGLWGPCAGS